MFWIFFLSHFFRGIYSHGGECAVYFPLELGGSPYSYRSYYPQYFLNSIVGVTSPGSCITYTDIEAAYELAVWQRGSPVNPPLGRHWEPEDIKDVGELLEQVTKLLATQFSLGESAINRFLPEIDTTKTSILNVCPDFASPMKCEESRYRRFDGLCNNLQHPTWGATRSVFQRLLPPVYSDGISAPRLSVSGGLLPSARLVSSMVHKDKGFVDRSTTLLIVAWGQLMDHDFTLTATPLDPINRNEPEDCCRVPPGLKNPYCFEIFVPPDDKFYNLFGTKCLDFVRGFPGVRQDCKLGPREQFNILPGVIDGNTIYGASEEAARELRKGRGGLLREHHNFETFGLKPLLPLKTDLPDEGCTRNEDSQNCFLAGEIRVNEQLILTCAHTVMMREHNRVAKELAVLNPHWDDEKLYQESRRIVAAEIQHVTFNEFLPQLLGVEAMEQFGLKLCHHGYWDGYDPTVNPSMTAAFVTSAFRFGHSLLPSSVERWSPHHKYIGSKRLSKLIRQPFDLHRPGLIDEYLLGMMNQPAHAMDVAITQEVTNHLFQDPHEKFGIDLVAFNLQRGREFGLPSYNEFRKFCGLDPAYSFEDLTNYMPNVTATKYSMVYNHVDDIDLWSGGVSERPKQGSLLGPTFTCVIAHQMNFVRKGDRFWYELPNRPSSFTPDQLRAIKEIRLARLICDNTDNIETIQLYPLLLQDHSVNPRSPCRSGVIPHLDLSPWKEAVPAGRSFPLFNMHLKTFTGFGPNFPFGFGFGFH